MYYFVLYGNIDEVLPEVPSSDYRSLGKPEGIELNHYRRDTNPEMWTQFQTNAAWEELQTTNPSLSSACTESPNCIILQGELPDTDNLDDLRDVIGLITYLFDCGAVVVLDLLTQTWYDMIHWRPLFLKEESKQ